MDKWNHNKIVRVLAQNIEEYKRHAKREIENNKVCHPSKIRNNSQQFLEICKQRYKDFTGDNYKTN